MNLYSRICSNENTENEANIIKANKYDHNLKGIQLLVIIV